MQLFNIPNFLTLINLFAGCTALVFLFNYHADWVIWCTLVSLVADFFDGFAARALNSASGIGKELDSLADVVSFGVVPGAIIYYILANSFRGSLTEGQELTPMLYALPSFLFSLFAALRLAKFNLDIRQSDGFIGLATPAASIFVLGLLQIYLSNEYGLTTTIGNPVLLFSTLTLLCYLMISELPMFSFKFKTYGWKGNELRYMFILVSLTLLVFLKFVALPLIVLIYTLTSLILKLTTK